MDEEENEARFEEDYYTFLNIPRNASPEEISNAYKRLSRCYHPDKHTDPALKKDAELLFNRTNRAYQVLSDPHKRAIYDSVGVKGLETDGWEVVLRTKTPQELREEYERLAQEEEERRLLLRTNPKGSVTVNINATDLFSRYGNDYDDAYDTGNSIFSSVEVSGMSITQSIEAPLTVKDTAVLGGEMGMKNGVGSGTINFSVRRLVSQKGWFKVEVGAGNGPMFSLQGYRTLTQRIFFNGGTVVHFTKKKIRPDFMGTLAMQLDTHTVGNITYRVGIQSAMNTTIIKSTPHSYTAFSIEFGLMRSFISLSYTHKLEERQMELKGYVKLGTFGWLVEYGATKKLSKHTSVSATVQVGAPTGVSLRIRLRRAYQSYNFPIWLSDEVFPAPVFYATVAPIVSWVLLKNFIVDPIVRERQQRDRDKHKESNKRLKQEKQKEARAAVELMKATFSRIRAEEETKKGLVITKALYGRFIYPQDRSNGSEETVGGQRDEIVDVTIPLQCLVKDSKLVLHNASKNQLPGFYDPCVGEDKQLLVQYLFHRQTHECLIKDTEPLGIPKTSHRVNTT